MRKKSKTFRSYCKMSLLRIFILTTICLFNNKSSAKSDTLHTIDEVIHKFQSLNFNFKTHKDHRLVFATTYLDSTIEIKKEILNNTFNYPNWVESIVVDFANLYIHSLESYKSGKKTALSWSEAFRINDEKYDKLSVQLMLAMNAHIYHDLPIALMRNFDKGFSPEQVKSDFFKMNAVFERLTPKFMAVLYDLEKILGVSDKGIKEWLVFQVVKTMRSDAWELGVQLFETGPSGRKIMLKRINLNSMDNAALIRAGRFLIPAH